MRRHTKAERRGRVSLRILKPGLLTTLQDAGRYGYQQSGMVVGGAMDAVALRLANLLVGNREHEAALEVTLQGPEILFEHNSLIAISGADLSPRINGRAVGMWRPVYIKEGCTLSFGDSVVGCRAYLAISGGLDVPVVMGSTATYLRGGMGGWQGRALQAGDVILCHEASEKALSIMDRLKAKSSGKGWVQANWMPNPQLHAWEGTAPVIRAIRGPEYPLFSTDSQQRFWEAEFQITAQSDRMGYRLEGGKLALKQPVSLLSTAVTFGTVQVPAEGNPIVLMADRQTTGGYPVIAQVATVDLPKLAQVPPGKQVKFTEISLEEAQQLYIQQEQDIIKFKRALAFKQ